MVDHKVVYPFVRCKVDLYDDEVGGLREVDSWKPGIEYRPTIAAYGEAEFDAFADAEGCMIITEVSRHKPSKYPERVFYTRKFIDPHGVLFGKTALRVCCASKFKRLIDKYQVKYEVKDKHND